MKYSESQTANQSDVRLQRYRFFLAVLISLIAVPVSTASAQRIRNTIPAGQVPASQLQQPPPLQTFPEITYLQAPKAKRYLLDSGDVLGVFIEGVLGQVGEAPPVNYPPESSRLGPSIGYPIVVRENGTISLPLVDPISVRGLTIEQAEALVKVCLSRRAIVQTKDSYRQESNPCYVATRTHNQRHRDSTRQFGLDANSGK